MTEIKNSLRTENSTLSRPLFIKVALLIEGSSVAIEVVVEDPSGSVFI